MSARWLSALSLLLLAGCAHEPVRHSPRNAGGVAGPAADQAGRHGVVDDISQPQSRRYQQRRDGSPDDPLDVRNLVEPVPRVEPRSRYGNKSPYTVLGHTYRVLDSAAGYDERGIASWYGTKFHGHLTSSLEPYDMYKFTAAHKTLPLPTYAWVTNLDNGKSVIVRINDRGPFHGHRLIDLSYAAAVRLGITREGTGRVEVRAIDPRHGEELPAPAVVSSAADKKQWFLQVGAFSDPRNAERLAARLRSMAIGPVRITPAMVAGRAWQRVRVGPLQSAAQANRANRTIQRDGLPPAQTVIEPDPRGNH